MKKTEVYQIRLESDEKQQAFAVFKQLGISPAQAVRLFFKQVVRTQSIPFSIEQGTNLPPASLNQNSAEQLPDTAIFAELDALLKASRHEP